ncbi:lysozyme [Gimibacter soli]|uniref:Lysozyme n=1 Tax=Gimibacter soli TaxID=3024400 RepID=A0AAE9XVY1_9PROT|nr:lysozyme [Gimibacter soli]WCL55098.1 lysozyme [Gimibacter soli]
MTEGPDFIKRFEGLHDGDRRTPLLEPMRDPVGIWTLGWGSIYDIRGFRVGVATPAISRDEAEVLLQRDFCAASEMAIRLSQPAELANAQIVALGSFVYNVGAAAFHASTLRRKVKENDATAVMEFGRWIFAGGRRLPGLVRRRAAEAALYLGNDPFG